MNKLNTNQRRHLRGLSHPLKPVVMLGGKGLTDNVLMEIRRALEDHELIKVRLTAANRKQNLHDIQVASGALLVQRIGHVATLYRRNPDKPKIALPK